MLTFTLQRLALLTLSFTLAYSQNQSTPSPNIPTADQILDNWSRVHYGAPATAPLSMDPRVASIAVQTQLLCTVPDLASGNWELVTSINKTHSAAENLAFSSSMDLALTSIFQSECKPNNNLSGPQPPPSMSIPNRQVRIQLPAGFATNQSSIPGYATMVRFKGMFAESLAPRQLTPLPGYGTDRIQANQALTKQLAAMQYNALPPDKRVEFSKLPPEERDKAVRDYWSASNQSLSPAQRAEMAQMANLPPEKWEEFAKLPPAEREKALKAWWQSYAMQHMGPHGVEMPNPEARKLQDLMWQSVSAMGPTSLPGAQPLAFLNLLQPNEALADIYKYKVREGDHFGAEHYLVAISANGTPPHLLQLGAAAPIDAAINSFYSRGSAPAPNAERGVVATAHQDRSKAWKALQTLVLAPMMNNLPSGTAKLIVSPDSSIALIPFASLALDMGVATPIAVIPSAYDFVRLRSSPSPPSPRRALIVGDLDYGSGNGSLHPLPATKDELNGVAALATAAGFQTVTMRGPTVTRQAITEKIRDVTILHIATHGLWSTPESNTVEQAFDQARLALSQANAGTPESTLSAGDILRLNLSKVQLITLSACSSGQGRPVDGQGLLGFQTAFMAAGARTLLISLWPVPDEATSELMRSFYRTLWSNPSISKADALRQAQMQLRSEPTFADPHNWAAWVLIGEAW